MDLCRWLRARGYWLRPGEGTGTHTHLLLDGGRLRVEDEDAFLAAYAASVASGGQRPCVVETRTPVFRLFVDLDARWATAHAPSAAARMRPVFDRLHAVVRAGFPGVETDMVVCATQPKAEGAEVTKAGFHVHWPGVLVEAPTARAFREAALEALAEVPIADVAGLVSPDWAAVVDSAVFKGAGLRMPWAAKRGDDPRFYAPTLHVCSGARIEVPRRMPPAEIERYVRLLSVRAPGRPASPTVLRAGSARLGSARLGSESSAAAPPVPQSLEAYAAVLPALAAALPPEFAGQRFVGAMRSGSGMVLLRSTSKFCLNLGRAHRTTNVYFVLSRRGVCQRCYCRCDTSEGRRFGPCKDFSSEVFPVPREALEAFFPTFAPAARSAPPPPPPLPSQQQFGCDLSALLSRTRAPAPSKRRRKYM